MNAVVSGRAARALIIEGQQLKSFDLDDPSTFVPRSQSDLPFLFGEARDLRLIKDVSIESVERELKADCDFTLALDLVLISLDAELEHEIRTEALEGLEELLASDATTEQLENVLFSSPKPEDADLNEALRLCETQEQPLTHQFLQKLEAHQPSVTKVNRAWEAIPANNFNSYEDREFFRRAAVKEGLFRTLATIDSPASLSTFMLKASLSQLIQRLPNYRQVLQSWITPFRAPRESVKIVKEEERDTVSEPQKFGRRAARLDRRAVLRETLRRKSVVVAAMHRRDPARVYDLVDDLVAYQQNNSESQHIAKSLCDLAMEAKELGMSSLQLALTERSINIAPGDGWSWTQHADALLKMQRLNEALRASDQAIAFGGGVVAKNGRAEVLKAMGRFDDALAVFDEVIEEDPENSITQNGRAEVLKAQGRFADALEAFNRVISRDSANVVAKTGRAEVLKAQGQLAAALTAYEEVIQLHPEDVVGKTGRAEVLKSQGQLAAALTAYEEVIQLHPDNVVAKNGRAEVLKAQNQLAAALTAYEEVIQLHPEDVVAKTGRAEVLKAQGHLAAALTAYEEVIQLHPEDVVAKTGRAEVLKAQGHLAAALTAYEEVIQLHPENVVAKNGRAEVLKAQGQLAAALTAYEEVIRESPTDRFARIGLSCVLIDLRRYDEALEALPKHSPVTIDDWIAYHIRGMILLRTGDTRSAIKIFSEGMTHGPFASTKDYFRGALGLSWLRGREFKKSEETLEAITSPTLQPSANVIRIHAFGAQGKHGRAVQAYENLAETPYLLNDELTQELHRQYVLGQKATKDDEWIFDREVRIFLRVA